MRDSESVGLLPIRHGDGGGPMPSMGQVFNDAGAGRSSSCGFNVSSPPGVGKDLQILVGDACMESFVAKEKCSGGMESSSRLDEGMDFSASDRVIHDVGAGYNSSRGLDYSSRFGDGMIQSPSVELTIQGVDAGKVIPNVGDQISEMIQDEDAVVVACMDCEVVSHDPVHENSIVTLEAFGRGLDSSMLVEPTLKMGESVFNFHSNLPLASNNSALSEDCSAPQPGKFGLSTGVASCKLNPACTPSVRHWASSKILDKFSAGESSKSADKSDCPSNPVWSRPVIVPLPSREEFGADSVQDGRVQLDVDEVLNTVKRFDMALVGRLFGRRFSFDFLNTELHRRWSGFGNFKLVTVNGDCFVCFFESTASRDAVVMGGPWIVAGQVIGVDYWTPTFSSTSSAGFVTPVWVRFPSLPMYCWGAKNIARIAGLLGEPVGMDAATDRLERGHFARVCIRLNLAKPLNPGMWIDGPFGSFFQNVEYEGLSAFCFQCGHVGHKAERCPSPAVEKMKVPHATSNGNGTISDKQGSTVMDCNTTVSSSVTNTVNVSANDSGEPAVVDNPLEEDACNTMGFGPWMLVSRKKKQQHVHSAGVNQNSRRPIVSSGSNKQVPVSYSNHPLLSSGGNLRSQHNVKLNHHKNIPADVDVGFSKLLSSNGAAAIRSQRTTSYNHNNVVPVDVKQNDKLKVHCTNAENEHVVKVHCTNAENEHVDNIASEISSLDFGHTHNDASANVNERFRGSVDCVAWSEDTHNEGTYYADDMQTNMQVHTESCRDMVQPNSTKISTLPRGSKKDKMVKELGPITSGSRFKKRKQAIPNNVGGDASSRMPP